MQYLVTGTGGPGFRSQEEVVAILEGVILPGFDELTKLQKAGKILAGGLPVGERAFVFIAEAASNDEVDQLVRSLPFWGALDWKVTPLQGFAERAAMERRIVKEIKERKR
jgi:muconolactone delta-isomerase